MKFFFNIKFCFSIFILLNHISIYCDTIDIPIPKKIFIKVLLDEISSIENKTLFLSCDQEMKLMLNNQKKIIKNVDITFINDCIYLNNEQFNGDVLQVKPINGHITFNDNEFQGTFCITKFNNKCLLINIVELEEYIYSVLKTESWPGWPLEFNKTLAIATRSYAIAKFLESKNKPYHIKNTNKHQTYKGIHKTHALKQAVEETQGIILGYNKKPILAMFDICCGGIIPAHIDGINFDHAPYLKRKNSCNYCKNAKLYSWEININKNELENILKQELPQLKKLKKIKIAKKDKAGVIKILEISDYKNKKHYITCKKFNSLFKKIKSKYFTLKDSLGKLIIKGKGFGHLIGLCQWGANEMVKQGLDYKTILRYYYPNTSLMKLK